MKDICDKILNYNRTVGITNQMFTFNFVLIHMKIRVYKTSAHSMLTYDVEAWIGYKQDESIVMAADMIFMRRMAAVLIYIIKGFRHTQLIIRVGGKLQM